MNSHIKHTYVFELLPNEIREIIWEYSNDLILKAKIIQRGWRRYAACNPIIDHKVVSGIMCTGTYIDRHNIGNPIYDTNCINYVVNRMYRLEKLTPLIRCSSMGFDSWIAAGLTTPHHKTSRVPFHNLVFNLYTNRRKAFRHDCVRSSTRDYYIKKYNDWVEKIPAALRLYDRFSQLDNWGYEWS